jgi:hypothetical protein
MRIQNKKYSRMCRHRLLTAVTVLLLSLPGAARAGRGDKAGTAAAPELLIPVGAASIGLGGACIATAVGVEGLYWNPAGLSRTAFGSSLLVSHMSYIADVNVEYAAAAINISGVGTAALSVKAVAIGNIPITTEEQPDGTGETASPTLMVIGGSFARNISDRISMGLTVSLIEETMVKVASSGLCFSAGVRYAGLGGIEGLEFGVVLKNLGPAMHYDGTGLLRTGVVADANRPGSPLKIEAATNDLPSSIDIGLGYTVPMGDESALLLSSSFLNNNYTEDEYKFGVQYAFENKFFLRGGYDFSSGGGAGEYIYGASIGCGMQTTVADMTIQFDYAYRAVQYFSGNHVLTLQIGR